MRICLLEQSGLEPDDLTRAKHLAANDLGFGYVRLNWNSKLWDRESPGVLRFDSVTWAEGRSLLYEHARRLSFDYFLFMDDDVDLYPRTALPVRFGSQGRSSATPWHSGNEHVHRIRLALRALAWQIRRFRPLSGCIFDPDDWAHEWKRAGLWRRPRARGPFPIGIHDLQTHLLHRDVADVAFPAPVPGSGASMWFVQFAGLVAWPSRQLCFTAAQARNTRRMPHQDDGLPQFTAPDALLHRLRPAVRAHGWEAYEGALEDRRVGRNSGGHIEYLNRRAMGYRPTRRGDPVSDLWSVAFDEQVLDDIREHRWE